ncbi:MAG: sulfatase-like hydrolase/transferase [Bacillota bacterium]|nr:sulfatase-like hydrolase/transferase [Bacillota bacterium]
MQAKPPRPPNILLILGDQHRADCVGVANRHAPPDVTVQPAALTPRLDRLGREGAVFTRAYTPAPVSAPARQALLSGRAPESFGALWNPNFIPTPTVKPEPGQHVAALRRAGYRSCLVGKWNSSMEHGPADFGFDCHIDPALHLQELARSHPDLEWTGGWLGETSPLTPEETAVGWGARQVERRLADFAGTQDPWFIRWDLAEPHLPCRPPACFMELFTDRELEPWAGFADPLEGKPYIQSQQLLNWELEEHWNDWDWWQPVVRRYLAVIAEIDAAVGRVLDVLEEIGQARDTLVIYSSDHGDLCGAHGMLDKHYVLYDDVTRVPLLLRWPAGVRGAVVRSEPVCSMFDIGATIIDACGLDGADPGLGESLLPLARGAEGGGRDAVVMAAHGQQFGLHTQRGLRTADWLYVWNLTDVDELYDCRRDPGQRENRIADPACAVILAALRKRLHKELRRRGDPFVGTPWTDRQLLDGRQVDMGLRPERSSSGLSGR